MDPTLKLEIILLQPPAKVVFGLQKGSGAIYETVQKQLSDGNDLSFACTITIKGDRLKDTMPKLSGPFVQARQQNLFILILVLMPEKQQLFGRAG